LHKRYCVFIITDTYKRPLSAKLNHFNSNLNDQGIKFPATGGFPPGKVCVILHNFQACANLKE
jgi:hypothetical protein